MYCKAVKTGCPSHCQGITLCLFRSFLEIPARNAKASFSGWHIQWLAHPKKTRSSAFRKFPRKCPFQNPPERRVKGRVPSPKNRRDPPSWKLRIRSCSSWWMGTKADIYCPTQIGNVYIEIYVERERGLKDRLCNKSTCPSASRSQRLRGTEPSPWHRRHAEPEVTSRDA